MHVKLVAVSLAMVTAGTGFAQAGHVIVNEEIQYLLARPVAHNPVSLHSIIMDASDEWEANPGVLVDRTVASSLAALLQFAPDDLRRAIAVGRTGEFLWGQLEGGDIWGVDDAERYAFVSEVDNALVCAKDTGWLEEEQLACVRGFFIATILVLRVIRCGCLATAEAVQALEHLVEQYGGLSDLEALAARVLHVQEDMDSLAPLAGGAAHSLGLDNVGPLGPVVEEPWVFFKSAATSVLELLFLALRLPLPHVAVYCNVQINGSCLDNQDPGCVAYLYDADGNVCPGIYCGPIAPHPDCQRAPAPSNQSGCASSRSCPGHQHPQSECQPKPEVELDVWERSLPAIYDRSDDPRYLLETVKYSLGVRWCRDQPYAVPHGWFLSRSVYGPNAVAAKPLGKPAALDVWRFVTTTSNPQHASATGGQGWYDECPMYYHRCRYDVAYVRNVITDYFGVFSWTAQDVGSPWQLRFWDLWPTKSEWTHYRMTTGDQTMDRLLLLGAAGACAGLLRQLTQPNSLALGITLAFITCGLLQEGFFHARETERMHFHRGPENGNGWSVVGENAYRDGTSIGASTRNLPGMGTNLQDLPFQATRRPDGACSPGDPHLCWLVIETSSLFQMTIRADGQSQGYHAWHGIVRDWVPVWVY